MSEHDAIRELLALAAADRVLGHGLRRLPTPQAPAMLVERTRQQIQLQLAAAAEHATNPWLLGFLVLLSWTLTIASWPIVRLVTQGMTSWLDLGFRGAWMNLVIYTLVGWAVGGAVALALALRRASARRTA